MIIATNLLNRDKNLYFIVENINISIYFICTYLYSLKIHTNPNKGILCSYINKTGNRAILGALEAPQVEFGSLREVFEQTYKHEQFITKKIFALADLSLELKDFSTFNFLQWYTAEQHEEEALFHGIIERFELIGEQGKGLFMIDKEIGNLLRQQ